MNPENRKPISLIYSLFEDKTYLEILKETIEKSIQMHEELLNWISVQLANVEEKIKYVVLDMYTIYRSEIKRDPLTSDQKQELLLLTNEQLKEKLKDFYVTEEDLNKLSGEYRIRFLELENELIRLLNEYRELAYAREKLTEELRYRESLKEIYKKVLDLLQLYPKHIRLGNLDQLELTAMRYFTDAYLSLLANGLLYGDVEIMEVANLIVLPYILNLQETSLSRDGFFLKLVHNAPLITELGPRKDELKQQSASEIFPLFSKDKEYSGLINWFIKK